MEALTRNLNSTILRVGSVLAGLVFWHFLATTVINDTTFLVSPIVVVATGYEMLFVNGELYPHLFASSWIFFYGFLLAIVAGVPLGFLMALSQIVRDYVNPWMTTLYTTPRIAFAPVLLLWFGVGGGAKVSIVFLGCVFPILINSYYGMRVVNREYVELARSFRLNSRALFFKILLPASVPFVLAGVRLAIGRGLTGVAIAEWFGATEGLGYLIFFAGQTLNIPTLFVGVAVFAALGIFGFEVVRRVEAYATPWKTDARGS
ncbi:MAG: ABC transporter permease [Deltaproteobacteria bacterium]|nr:ABC transporter permease [Deltaproteobacteria bacterium]MBI2368118.1 ABC transporter permease [Deltaproteobacteria bacterium]MBI2531224.1 ABC transporter permease [Deltaproteobacteria bacterium]MBI3065853.1 ABC transporter permease [Deltaproteobacteria bacterium]